MKVLAESEARTTGNFLAQHTVNSLKQSSHMTVEGGRVFVHALKRVDTIPKGSVAIPVSIIHSFIVGLHLL